MSLLTLWALNLKQLFRATLYLRAFNAAAFPFFILQSAKWGDLNIILQELVLLFHIPFHGWAKRLQLDWQMYHWKWPRSAVPPASALQSRIRATYFGSLSAVCFSVATTDERVQKTKFVFYIIKTLNMQMLKINLLYFSLLGHSGGCTSVGL